MGGLRTFAAAATHRDKRLDADIGIYLHQGEFGSFSNQCIAHNCCQSSSPSPAQRDFYMRGGAGNTP